MPHIGRHILLLITLLTISVTTAYGQELYDYRYYKLFDEESEPTELTPEQRDSVVVASRIRNRRTYSDYVQGHFNAVRIAERGSAEYRSAYLGSLALSGADLRAARSMRLASSHNTVILASQNPNGAEFFAVDTTAQPLSALRVALSDRSYVGAASFATVQHFGKGWQIYAYTDIRAGKDMHATGVFENSVSANTLLLKRFNNSNTISFGAMFTPSERGTRQSSTAEAFALTGNNLYNPSWGYQSGKVRNSHVRRNCTPFMTAAANIRLSPTTTLAVETGATVGVTAYSSLAWYDAATPMPDNYHYMPSYFSDEDISTAVADAWRRGDTRYTQIDWDELYAQNRLAGGDAAYVVEQRVERIARVQAAATIQTTVSPCLTAQYGIRTDITNLRRYKRLEDLLGAQYLTDIDQYLVDDSTYGNSLQNNTVTPWRKVHEGDRFGFDYTLARFTATAFAALRYEQRRVNASLTAQISQCNTSRTGHYRKELFADNSLGKSSTARLSPYSLCADAGYTFSRNHRIAFKGYITTDTVDADDMFLQVAYNNRLVDNIALRHNYLVAADYHAQWGALRTALTLYLRSSDHDSRVEQFYDDLSGEYCDMVVSGISTMSYGAELLATVQCTHSLRLELTASLTDSRYTRDARINLYADNDNRLICNNITAYMHNCRTACTPSAQISFSPVFYNRGWSLRARAEYIGGRHVAPSAMRRTARVVYEAADSREVFDEFMRQEQLSDVITVDASVAKTIYLDRSARRQYRRPYSFAERHPSARLTIYISVSNLLNTRSATYSGYESSRILRTRIADGYTYRPFANRYLYAYPRTFILSAKFSF